MSGIDGAAFAVEVAAVAGRDVTAGLFILIRTDDPARSLAGWSAARLPRHRVWAASGAGSRPGHFLENFRTPGRTSCLEDCIGMGNCTRVQLLNAQTTCELRPRKSAQVYRAKDADVATQTGGFVGALDTCRTDPPAACIARAKFINHLNDHGSVSLI